MAVVAIVSQKGGSGKTTLALHLASAAAYAKQQSIVIDTDPQATAAAWGDWRGEFLPEIVTSPPARLGMTIRKAERAGTQFMVIDTPPHADAAMREAIKAADLVLIPTRLRAFDLHALDTVVDLLGMAGTPAFVLFNAVPARATKLVTEARTAVEERGLQVCPVQFGERADFHRSSAKGEVAAEIDPAGKAAGEVDALWQWVHRIVPSG